MHEAVRLGIYDPVRGEHVDSVTGSALKLPQALRRARLRLATTTKMKRRNETASVTSLSDSRSIKPKKYLQCFDPASAQSSRNSSWPFLLNENNNNSESDRQKEEAMAQKSVPSDYRESQKAEQQQLKSNSASVLDRSVNASGRNEKQVSSQEAVSVVGSRTQTPLLSRPHKEEEKEENTKKMLYQENSDEKYSNVVSALEKEFDLGQSLYLKKMQNAKYIKFEQVCKKRLYDPGTGRVTDPHHSEQSRSIMDALRNGVLKCTDARCLLDARENCLYVIEHVLDAHSQFRMTLQEAIEAGCVQRGDTYSYVANDETRRRMSFREAMNLGYVQGRLLTASEVKWLLDEFFRTVNSSDNKNQGVEKEVTGETAEDEAKLKVDYKETEEYNEDAENGKDLFIYDPEQERYIPLRDAFSKGLVLSEPLRVRGVPGESGGGGGSAYILFKDAVVKGLLFV